MAEELRTPYSKATSADNTEHIISPPFLSPAVPPLAVSDDKLGKVLATALADYLRGRSDTVSTTSLYLRLLSIALLLPLQPLNHNSKGHPEMTHTISMLRLTPKGMKSRSSLSGSFPNSPPLLIELPPLILPPAAYSPPRRALTLPGARKKKIFTPNQRRRRSNSWSAIMSESFAAAKVPSALVAGVPMLKISSKKIKQVIMRLNDGVITWTGANNSKVPLSQVREIRLGEPPSDIYNDASRWITIVYVKGSQWKVLHMIALTDDVYDAWVSVLPTLVSESSDRIVGEVKPCDPDLLWIRQLWPAGSKVIDMPTAVGLCRSIGLVVPEGMSTGKGSLDMTEFRQMIREAQSRPELRSLFEKLSGGNGKMEKEEVEAFIRDVQKLEPGDAFIHFARGDIWTLESLTDFLTSTENVSTTPDDMRHSITEYYISSSHNTYLVGEQWRGESTIEGYIRVLLGGCRCVEMDVHNGEHEPVVHHKKTFTTSIAVRDICRAILKYGFIASPYPIIISAEIHCDAEQQDLLASIMRDTFGDKLVTTPLPDHAGPVSRLPSPEDLKHRILFKAKLRDDKSAASTSPPTPKFGRFDTFDSTDSTTESDSGRIGSLVRRLSFGSPKSPEPIKPTVSTALRDLLVYTAGVKYQGFSKLVTYDARDQFSLSDRTGQKLIKESRGDWIKHNFSHLSRIYPQAIRVMSSNYDPRPFWLTGCQLVALNWQTVDEELVLNHAMFADTPGYVLKPLALRQKVTEATQEYRVSVQIISAQRLPLGSDLHVEATLGESEEQKTTTVKGTALNPRWDETLSWTIRTTPSEFDLTFLQLSIKNRGLVAQWVRPMSAAPRGYHHLPLWDSLCSKYVFATLFARIDVVIVP